MPAFTRREFDIWAFRGSVGALASAFAHHLASNSLSNFRPKPETVADFTKSIGPDRLDNRPEWILEHIAAAKPGVLMAQYQLFWPPIINHALDAEALLKLNTLCEQSLNDKNYSRSWHRIRALPAVASIHALSFVDRTIDREDREILTNILLKTHDADLHTSEYSQTGVVRILWKNALAATIRNRESWSSIVFEDSFLERGVEICRKFLRGEKPLFGAAFAVFQFLLTYQRALKDRRDDSASRVVGRLIHTISQDRTFPEYHWFERLAEIYGERHTHREMIPQLTEVLMGLGAIEQKVFDYFLLSRLHEIYIYHLVAEGAATHSYFRPEFGARLSKEYFESLFQYHIDASQWRRVRSKAPGYLNRDEIVFFDKQFENYRAQGLDVELGAERIASLVPFYKHDEQEVFAEAYARRSTEGLKKAILDPTTSLFGLVAAAEPLIHRQTMQFGAAINANLTTLQLLERIEKEVPPEISKEALQIFQARSNDLLPFFRSFSGWSASDLKFVTDDQKVRTVRSVDTDSSKAAGATEGALGEDMPVALPATEKAISDRIRIGSRDTPEFFSKYGLLLLAVGLPCWIALIVIGSVKLAFLASAIVAIGANIWMLGVLGNDDDGIKSN